jgi:putative transcriptional regulator
MSSRGPTTTTTTSTTTVSDEEIDAAISAWFGLLAKRRSPLGVRRIAAGLSQAELGSAVGASRKTIGSIERGASTPSVRLALALAHALGTTVEALFDARRPA